MKRIEKDELYDHLGEFLKAKGIELREGSYTKGIHAGCSLLADAINLSQSSLERAKAGLDKKLDQVRQVIHERTAPKPPVAAKPGNNSATKAANASGAKRPTKQPQRKPKAKARSPKPKT